MRTIILLIALAPTGVQAAEPETRAAEVFQRLTSLAGNWEGKFSNGRAHGVAYRLTAGGTVLVETWSLGPDRESMTLYHLDGEALIATHYCPQGNQPRLQFVGERDDQRLSFEFRDGTNLRDRKSSHQHGFWIQLGNKSFVRSETYVQNGSTASEIAAARPEEPVTYMRVETAR